MTTSSEQRVNVVANELQSEILEISASMSSMNEKFAKFQVITKVLNDHSGRLKHIEDDKNVIQCNVKDLDYRVDALRFHVLSLRLFVIEFFC